MTASVTIYIGDSSDEGFIFHPNERGNSHWLVLSAAANIEVTFTTLFARTFSSGG